jgi:DNA-binding NtrC family response regulator
MTASRILVVDDEADIRSLLSEILSEEGYEVDVAADAGQARSSRASQVPDLVLLDIWMPDTDGITLLREWSVTDGYDCPVVMMSGHGTVETAWAPSTSSRSLYRSPNCCAPWSVHSMPAAANGSRSARKARVSRCRSARVE